MNRHDDNTRDTGHHSASDRMTTPDSGSPAKQATGRHAPVPRERAETATPLPVAMPLPAAMAYFARRVSEALESAGDASAQAVLDALAPDTRELLRWWFGHDACRRRRRNFHIGQREAILHTILACELFDSDDPLLLFGAACSAWPGAMHTAPAQAMTGIPATAARERVYRLRMTPGSGVRWVILALALWRWAGIEARRAPSADKAQACRPDLRFHQPATGSMPMRSIDAIDFMRHDDSGQVRSGFDDVRRYADVFLPPTLRERFADWCALCEENGIDTAQALPTGPLNTGAAPLRIDIDTGEDAPPADVAVLCEISLTRALRIGAVKALALVDTGLPRRGSACDRAIPHGRQRRGARPVLPRREQPLLNAGLALLDRIERETHALRAYAGREAPALLVLCEAPELRRAVAVHARRRGLAHEAIVVCDPDNVTAQSRARLVVDSLPPRHAAMQSRFCAVVLLRASRGNSRDEHRFDTGDSNTDRQGVCDLDLAACLWPALAPNWRERMFAEAKNADRERIGSGRMPQTLIDVLVVIAAAWPRPQHPNARTGQPLSFGRFDALPAPAGDLFIAQRREQVQGLARGRTQDLDIVLPDPSPRARTRPLRWYSQQAPRLLSARQALPVRKCVQSHQGWSAHNDGLERGLIEMAEADPHIAAFCLFDPVYQPWPDEDDGHSDAPRGAPPVCPNALVRTPGYVYVVSFVPYLSGPAAPASVSPVPVSAGVAAASMPADRSPDHGSGREPLVAWCKRVNALPADRRQFREWRAATVQAPLFWSWKRRGGSLSSLLSALADTTPIHLGRPRNAPPHSTDA